MKLLSLPDTLHVLSPSLRFCISGFHNQKSSYHISARFASAEADFVAIFRFRLCFPPGYGMLSATFYWKEGAPTWVGTAAFSSKKETLKHFRLEVRPFLGIALSVCCAASSPQGGKDEVCAMPKPLLPGEVSPKVTERLYEGQAFPAAVKQNGNAACSTTSPSRLWRKKPPLPYGRGGHAIQTCKISA